MQRRERLLKIIRGNPGIHVRGLMRESGLENGVVMHHLRQLERDGKVKSQRHPRYRGYYPADVFEEEIPVIQSMRRPTKKEILLRIIVEGNPSFRDLASKMDKSPAALSWNLSGLIEAGVVEKCRKDGRDCYRITDRELFKKTFKKEFASLFDEKAGHAEDIFLAL